MLNVIAGVYPIDGGKIVDMDITSLAECKRAAFIGRVQDPCLGLPIYDY